MRTGQEVAQWLRWLRLDWPSPCVTSQRRTQHDVRTSWLYAIMPNQSTHTPLQFIFSPFTRRQPSQNWCDFPIYFGSLMQNVFECQHPTIPPSQHESISLITAWRSPQKRLGLSTNIRFMWGVRIPINLNLLVYTPVAQPVDDICCLRWSEGSTKLRRFVSSTSSPTTPFLKRHTFSNPEIWISDISRPFGRYGIYRYMQKFIAMFWVFWTTVVRQSDFWSQCRIDLLPLGSKIAGSHFFSHGKQFQNPEKYRKIPSDEFHWNSGGFP